MAFSELTSGCLQKSSLVNIQIYTVQMRHACCGPLNFKTFVIFSKRNIDSRPSKGEEVIQQIQAVPFTALSEPVRS